MHAPLKDITRPNRAKREGLILKRKLEISIEKMGVVLTSTVALSMVVSFTADTKNMKWSPRKIPKIVKSLRFLAILLNLRFFLIAARIKVKIADAMTSRQKAIENVSSCFRKRMKMDAVPKRIPAVMPSVNASVRVRLGVKAIFTRLSG